MSVKQLITADELRTMPEVPGKRFELINGEMVEVPGTNILHSLLVFWVARLIAAFVEEQNLGLVTVDGSSYVIRTNPDTVRIPDVAFISWQRMPDPLPLSRFWPIPPDLAVEVVSPDDRANELHEKAQDYLEAGSRQVWILWPQRRSMTVHTAAGPGQELGPNDELDGGDVLAGYRVRVGDLFNVRTHP